MANICITIPKTIKWSDYEKELEAVKDGNCEMNYRIPTLPKDVNVGDRCYICHDGYVKGWMRISGIGHKKAFRCTTTGEEWAEGNYVSRSGEFHPLKNPIPMKGFMGYRKFEEPTMNESRNFIITEEQYANTYKHVLSEVFVPNSALVTDIKKYLDKGFRRVDYDDIGEDGDLVTKFAVSVVNDQGQPLQTISPDKLLDKLDSKFKTKVKDDESRRKFLKQVIVDWFNDAISKEGLLSVNTIK